MSWKEKSDPVTHRFDHPEFKHDVGIRGTAAFANRVRIPTGHPSWRGQPGARPIQHVEVEAPPISAWNWVGAIAILLGLGIAASRSRSDAEGAK